MILAGMKLEELESLMAEMNATKFRAKQIHNWIYSKSVSCYRNKLYICNTYVQKWIITEIFLI